MSNVQNNQYDYLKNTYLILHLINMKLIIIFTGYYE